MKKRLLLKLGLVALLGAGLFVAWLWWTQPRTGICRYTASKIRPGMTEEEVTELIGFPSGVHGSGWKKINWISDNEQEVLRTENALKDGDSGQAWICRSGAIGVLFDRNGKVLFAYYSYPDSLLDRVRGWLHLD